MASVSYFEKREDGTVVQRQAPVSPKFAQKPSGGFNPVSYFEKREDGSLAERQAPISPQPVERKVLSLQSPSYFEKRPDGTLQKQSVPHSTAPLNDLTPSKNIKILFAPTPEADKRFYRRVEGELKVFNKLPQLPALSLGFPVEVHPTLADEGEKGLLSSASPPRVSHFPVFTAKSWECQACTFVNEEAGTACEMCGTATGRTSQSDDSDDFSDNNSDRSESDDEIADEGETSSSWALAAQDRGYESFGSAKAGGGVGNAPNPKGAQRGVWRKTKKLLTRSSSWAAAAAPIRRNHSNRVTPERNPTNGSYMFT